MADLQQMPIGNGVDDIVKLLGFLDFGTGKTTTKTSLQDNGSMDQANQLFAQLMSGADGPTIDAMVANILEQAKEKFAPVIGNSKAAGVRAYSDTTLQYLGSVAVGKATGEAAKAKLDAMATNNKIAAGLVEAKMQAAPKVVESSKGASPATKAAALAGPALLAYNKLKAKKNNIPGASVIGEDFTAQAAELSAQASGQSVQGVDAALSNFDIGVSELSGDLAAPQVVDVMPEIASSAEAIYSGTGFLDATSEFVGDLATDTAITAGTDVVTDIATDVATDAAVDAGTSTVIDGADFLDFDFMGDFGFFDWFADGGVVPKGKKKVPGYADGGEVEQRKPTAYDFNIINKTITPATIDSTPADANAEPVATPTNNVPSAAQRVRTGFTPEDIELLLLAENMGIGGDTTSTASPGVAVGEGPTPGQMGAIALGMISNPVMGIVNAVTTAITGQTIGQHAQNAVIGHMAEVEGANVGEAAAAAGDDAEGVAAGTATVGVGVTASNEGPDTSSDTAPDAGNSDAAADAGAAGGAGDAGDTGSGDGDGFADGRIVADANDTGVEDDKLIRVSGGEVIAPADTAKVVIKPGDIGKGMTLEEIILQAIDDYHVPAAQQRQQMKRAA